LKNVEKNYTLSASNRNGMQYKPSLQVSVKDSVFDVILIQTDRNAYQVGGKVFYRIIALDGNLKSNKNNQWTAHIEDSIGNEIAISNDNEEYQIPSNAKHGNWQIVATTSDGKKFSKPFYVGNVLANVRPYIMELIKPQLTLKPDVPYNLKLSIRNQDGSVHVPKGKATFQFTYIRECGTYQTDKVKSIDVDKQKSIEVTIEKNTAERIINYESKHSSATAVLVEVTYDGQTIIDCIRIQRSLSGHSIKATEKKTRTLVFLTTFPLA